MPSSAPLPAREQNTFKSVVRFYETKQLKKAIKSADSILKNHPEHGETLAMKGLALNALDRKEEAHELVRKGLRLDMQSHICWHVYGLLYRSDRDYRAAAKAYLNALRFDKDNQQILRDLSLLQIQIRDFEGLEETRRKLLTLRPSQKNNWIGFALSFHLLGNFATAISVLDTYQDTLKGDAEPEDAYEVSELALYKNLMLEESGDYSVALHHLEENESRIVDRLALRETRARLYSYLGRHEDCAAELQALLAINPDNVAYHRGIQCTAVLLARAESGDESPEAEDAPTMADFRKRMSVEVTLRTDEDFATALKACDDLSAQYPRSRTSSRIALEIIPSADHPQFLPRLDAYVRTFLRRGIPSLFSDIKPMYSQASKSTAIGGLFEKYLSSLKGPVARLPPLLETKAKPVEGGEDEKPEAEDTLLWVLHFLAQHYDRVGLHMRAIELIDEAIALSPKTVECLLAKARILKHAGDTVNAVEVADAARQLDLADRYINTKCTKYALRADKVAQAESWIGLFTRDGDSGGPQALYDMQCMWFELEAAESHLRRGQFALALKKFTAVERHFGDMVEDQFDFHSYCLRKVTLRAYISLLRFEDRIRADKYFARAAYGAVKCLLRLADLPPTAHYAFTGEHGDIEGFADMSPAERKKAISKQKKKRLRGAGANPQANVGKGGRKGAGKATGKSAAQASAKANGSAKTEPNGKLAAGEKGACTGGEKNKGNPGWMETDRQGTEYVKGLLDAKDRESKGMEKDKERKDPLDVAVLLVREVETHLAGRVESHVLAYEVAIRRKRYLQALRAVKRAQAIDGDDPATVDIAVRFAHEMEERGGRDDLSAVAQSVFDIEGDVLGGLKPAAFLADYSDRAVGNARNAVGAARIKLRLASEQVAEMGTEEEACEKLVGEIRKTETEGVGEGTFTALMCKSLIDCLRAAGSGTEVVGRVVGACRERHPKASCFEWGGESI